MMATGVNDRTRRMQQLRWFLHGAGALALIAVLAGLHAGCLRPLAHWESECRARAAELDQLWVSVDQIRAEHDKLEAELAELEDRLDLLRRRVPAEPQETEFLEQINEVARASGFHISDFRRGNLVATSSISELELQVAGTGSFPAICRFFDGLKALPRAFSIRRVAITSNGGPEAYPVTMAMTVYYGETTRRSNEEEGQHG